MNDANQKKGLSPLAIVGIVVAVVVALGLATCGAGAWVAGKKLGDVKRNMADGGLVMVSPEAVTTALAGEKKAYVGTWTSKSGASTLKIAANGAVEYARNESANKSTLNGPIAAFDGNDMVMKLGIEFRIKVAQPPAMVDTKMQMVADGITFLRESSPLP